MKLTHKQKAKKARQMLAQFEKSTYFFNKDDNTWYRKQRTPLFQSKRWNAMSQAKAIKVQNKQHGRQEAGIKS